MRQRALLPGGFCEETGGVADAKARLQCDSVQASGRAASVNEFDRATHFLCRLQMRAWVCLSGLLAVCHTPVCALSEECTCAVWSAFYEVQHRFWQVVEGCWLSHLNALLRECTILVSCGVPFKSTAQVLASRGGMSHRAAL